jgi:hypothetical protein
MTRPRPATNLIPGASVIGRGFNILGSYSTRSLMPEIISLGANTKTWEYMPTQITYDVPENASPIDYTNSTGTSYVYNTQEQFQSHFAQKSGVAASFGAFSGQFNLAYSQTEASESSCYYGIYEADYTAWQLNVDNTSANWLTPEFTDDPDVQALPDTFTPQNQELFFTVFRKWGTHYVAQVIVGGSLDYYEAVMTSYSSSETQIQANIELEYKAVFTSSRATSELQWAQLGQNWADSRTVTVSATGGDNSPLNALNPSYGDSDSDIFTSWASAVMQNPSVIEFTLRPLNLLFSGATATAVQAALYAYTNGAVVAYGTTAYTPGDGPAGGDITTSWSIQVNGTIARPQPPVIAPPPDVIAPGVVIPVGGYQIALLDPVSYEPLMSHLYYQTYIAETEVPNPLIYDEIMADIDTIPPETYVAVVVGFAIDLRNYPSRAFSEWLMSVGATMTGWQKFVGYNLKGGLSNYVCVGRQGFAPGHAIESFQAMYDTTWMEAPYLYSMYASAVVLTYGGTDLTVAGPAAFGSLGELSKAAHD